MSVGCEKCSHMGFVLIDEDGEEVWKPCECRKQQDEDIVRNYKLTEANIPKAFRHYTIESYEALPFRRSDRVANLDNIQTIKNYLLDPKEYLKKNRVLWIWGNDPNSGHTGLALICGMKLVDLNYKVRFFKFQELLDAFKDFDNKASYFSDLDRVQIYVIDDAFDITSSYLGGQYTQVQLFQFFDEAFSKEKNFIMTSNVPVLGISEEIYGRTKAVIRRSVLELEFKGDMTTCIDRGTI